MCKSRKSGRERGQADACSTDPLCLQYVLSGENTITNPDFCSNMSKNAQTNKVQPTRQSSDKVPHPIREPLGTRLFPLSSCPFLLHFYLIRLYK